MIYSYERGRIGLYSDWDSANEARMLDIQRMIEALMPVFNWTGLWMVSFCTTVLTDAFSLTLVPSNRWNKRQSFDIDPDYENRESDGY